MKHILIIDNNTDILDMLETTIHLLGFTGTGLTTENDLTAAIKQKTPDVVLTNVSILENTGNICNEIRKAIEPQRSPIILMSTSKQLLQSYKQCGADDFIEKPFDLIVLADVLQSNIDRYEMENRQLAKYF